MASYNQRAVCVRIVSPCNKMSLSKPRSLKFIIREEGSSDKSSFGPGYTFNERAYGTKEEFYEKVSGFLEGFQISEMNSEYWNKISKYLEMLDFQYHNYESVNQWVTVCNPPLGDTRAEDLRKKASELQLSKGQRQSLSLFGAALKCGMENCSAKVWMEVLVQEVVESMDKSRHEVLCIAPSNHCSINTSIEAIRGDLKNDFVEMEYNAVYVQGTGPDSSNYSSKSSDSSNYSLASNLSTVSLGSCETSSRVSRCKVVPDLCVATSDYPGSFPLVVKLKPAGHENEGCVQNIPQMYSKLFFQDAVFGLVVTSRSYQMSAMVKDNGQIHYLESPRMMFAHLNQGYDKLNIHNVFNLYTFIASILNWAFKTGCKHGK